MVSLTHENDFTNVPLYYPNLIPFSWFIVLLLKSLSIQFPGYYAQIIPYLASQFRKDKIWLRRSQPSQREYRILMAVDDSSSMSDNLCRQVSRSKLYLLFVWVTFGFLSKYSRNEDTGVIITFLQCRISCKMYTFWLDTPDHNLLLSLLLCR